MARFDHLRMTWELVFWFTFGTLFAAALALALVAIVNLWRD